EAMREVFKCTRPLPDREWAEYVAFERINERGIGVDINFVEAAARMAIADEAYINARLAELTNGIVTKVTQVDRLARWLHEHTPDAEIRSVLLKDDQIEEEEAAGKPTLSLTRKKVSSIVALLTAKRDRFGLSDDEKRCLEAAVLRQYGG